MATSAEEALARAKAIAARLSGQSVFSSTLTTTTTTTVPAPTLGSQSQTDGTEAAASKNTGKRKRWGVTPDVLQTTPVAPAVAAAFSMNALSSSEKKAKTAAATENAVVVDTKRIWISTTETRPPSHYVAFLRDKLVQIEEESKVKITLEGKGASSKPPLPGMPEQPLHILVTGSKEGIDEAENKIDVLLQDAEQAPFLAGPEEDNSLALTVAGSSKDSGVTSNYSPAPVAHLIGRANLPPQAQGGDWIEEPVEVPNGVVGFIIGRGGENISSMQARTGCKVQIQKEHELQPGSTVRTITLSAPNKEAIEECREIIMNMVREKTAFIGNSSQVGSNASKDERLLHEALQAGHKLVQVKVPDADVGLVIGKMGTTIRNIQDQTGANIQVPPAADAKNGDGVALRTINITHPTSEGANQAKLMIENILKTKAPTAVATGAQQITVQILIPDKDVGLCIGRQGCVIREMQNRSNTRIQIPTHPIPGEAHRIATVSGTKEGCDKVQQMIQAIIMAQSSAPVMSGNFGPGRYQPQPAYFGGAQQQQQPDNQQQYSAEWAAYHAAQAAQQAANVQAQQQQQQAQQVQQQQAQQQQVQQQQYSAPVNNVVAASAQPSADAYYEQFFRYAYYYGEEAARAYYGAWSPPVGTPNPYGVNTAGIQPQPQAAAIEQAAPAVAVAVEEARETGRRKVSNLPAWMTKGQG